jgi:hypothetical protein
MQNYTNPGLGLSYKAAVERNGGYDIVPYANAKKDTTTQVLIFGALALGAYLLLMPKKKSKSSGLNGPKGKKRKAGKRKK